VNQPWGLSGPQFLGLYIVALALSVLLVMAVRAVVRNAAVSDDDRAADRYTVAVLSGGTQRVVDTAVQALIEGRQLRADRDHSITVCGTRAPDEPVQRAVLASLGWLGSTNLIVARRVCGTAIPVQRIARAAAERGAAAHPGASAGGESGATAAGGRLRRRDRASGERRHMVEGLAASLVPALLATVPLLILTASRTPRLTGEGEKVLQQARQHQRRSQDRDWRQDWGQGRRPGLRTPSFYRDVATHAPVPSTVLGVAALGPAGVTDSTQREALYGGISSSSGWGGGIGGDGLSWSGDSSGGGGSSGGDSGGGGG
jgi:uncharacterized protein (TIGR04222 family)